MTSHLITVEYRSRRLAGQRISRLIGAIAVVYVALAVTGGAAASPPAAPDFGPNVIVFDPSMSTSQIQAAVDAIAAPAGPEPVRDAALRAAVQARHLRLERRPAQLPGRLLHRGRRASASSPNDVVINGSVYVYNQCDARQLHRAEQLLALAVEPDHQRDDPELRLLHRRVLGRLAGRADAPRARQRRSPTLMDYCTGPSFASGGFIADSQFDGGTVINGSQQQWLVRNSSLDGWTNGVWNQVFSGVVGAPAQCFPAQRRAAARTPRSRPARSRGRRRTSTWTRAGATTSSSRRRRRNSVGTTWASGPDARHVDPDRASSSSPTPARHAQAINNALGSRAEPALHARRLPPRQDDQGQARRHRRARPRLPDARPDERRRRR